MNEKLKDVGKRIGSLDDLPEELKKQLQIAKIDDLEEKIIEIIKDFDKIANLDEILVGLYRKYEIIQDRAYLANKMYRMVKAGHVESVKGKRGVYKMD